MRSKETPATDDERATLLAELADYVPADERERAMARQLTAFLGEYSGAFERALAIGHMTGSAWVVDRAGTCALLTHHRKLGKWLQLGGHADGDQNIRRVALSEACEESGLRTIVPASARIFDLDVHTIPARENESAHLHYDVRFAFYANPEEVPRAGSESHAVAWIPLAGIERYAIDDSVRRLVRKTPALVRGASS